VKLDRQQTLIVGPGRFRTETRPSYRPNRVTIELDRSDVRTEQ